MNECDWHILAGNEERIKSHCLTRKYYARSVGKLDWFGSSNCKQNDLRSWCVCYRLSNKWELFSLIYCLLLLSLLHHWCFNNLNDLDIPTCESGKFESLEADCMDFCFKPNGKSFCDYWSFMKLLCCYDCSLLFEWKAYCLSFVLQLMPVSWKSLYKDAYRRTIEILQLSRILNANCCLKVDNANIKLTSPVAE